MIEKNIKQVKQEVINIIRDVNSSVSISEDKDNDRNLKDIGIDSLDNMSIFLAVQEKFKLEDIPDEKIDNLATVNLIVAYINDQLSKKEKS